MASSLLRAGVALALLSLSTAPAVGASRFVTDPYPSTYQAHPDAPVLIQNATVLTGTGQRLDNADVLLRRPHRCRRPPAAGRCRCHPH